MSGERLWLRALAFEVRVPDFRVAVAPCILASPALVPALSLDLLPDNRVVLCADKGVAPPVGWAKYLQQLALDGIYVLEALFEGVLVLMSRPHDEPPALQRNSPDASQDTPASAFGKGPATVRHRLPWQLIDSARSTSAPTLGLLSLAFAASLETRGLSEAVGRASFCRTVARGLRVGGLFGVAEGFDLGLLFCG
jgi:hypothetical protein